MIYVCVRACMYTQVCVRARVCMSSRVCGLTGLGCEVDTECSDGVIRRVVVQLCHQQIIILHPQRKLLHV